MSSFTRSKIGEIKDQATDERTNKGRVVYEVLEDFEWEIGWLGSGWKVRITKGFRYDRQSIPKPVDWFLTLICHIFRSEWWQNKKDSIKRSSGVHDWMLKNTNFEKPTCDATFYEAMCAEGTSPWFRELCWRVVSLKRIKD